MATISVGAAGKGNILSALYDVDFDPVIPLLVMEEGKFTRFLQQIGEPEDLMAVKAEWGYSEARDAVDTVATVATAADLSVHVTNIGQWGPNDAIMHAASGETSVVESVNHATSRVQLTERSRGQTAAAAFAQGDSLINLGPAYPDGASITEARMVVDQTAENYVQLFWENVEFDGTTLAINAKKGLRGGNYESRKRKETLLNFMRRMDYAHLFGEAVDNGVHRTMGGLWNFVAATESATIPSLTDIAFDNHLEQKGLLHGSDNKVLVTSNYIHMGLNRQVQGRMHVTTNVGGSKAGYKLKTLETPMGDITILPHYNFSVVPEFKGRGLLMDKASVQRAVLRPMKLFVDIETGTKDVRMDAWMAQVTAKWGHPRNHSKFQGVNAFT